MLALGLVTLNGFFVLSEFALVKVRRTRLQELADNGKKSAQVALEVSGHIDTSSPLVSSVSRYLHLALLVRRTGYSQVNKSCVYQSSRLVPCLYAYYRRHHRLHPHRAAPHCSRRAGTKIHCYSKTENSALLTAGPLKAFIGFLPDYLAF